MDKTDSKSRKLVTVFLLGCLLFNYPLLSLFNRDVAIWGIPLLLVYLFAAWVVLIYLLARIISRDSDDSII